MTGLMTLLSSYQDAELVLCVLLPLYSNIIFLCFLSFVLFVTTFHVSIFILKIQLPVASVQLNSHLETDTRLLSAVRMYNIYILALSDDSYHMQHCTLFSKQQEKQLILNLKKKTQKQASMTFAECATST